MLDPKQFKRLQRLDDRLLDEVNTRLLHGHTAASVARMLQAEGRCTDFSLDTLTRQLRRFRERAILPAVADGTLALPADMPKVDVIRELCRLLAHQRRRVDRLLRLEAGKPILLEATGKELERYVQMLCRMAWLQLEVGILRRAPKPVARVITVEADGGGIVDPRVISFRADDADATDSLSS